MRWPHGSDKANDLNDQKVKHKLNRYFEVTKRNKQSKYILATSFPADYSDEAPIGTLWNNHETLLREFQKYQEEVDNGKVHLYIPDKSFLNLKIELAKRIMRCCEFCDRRCNVDRLRGNVGYCGCREVFMVYSCFLHMGEEPELVPSGTIFTGGCSISCIHCQNWDISQWMKEGNRVNQQQMSKLVENLVKKGCKNINMVGGDPTPYVWLWLDTMKHLNFNISKEGNNNKYRRDWHKTAEILNVPLVWNSNSYYSEETAKLLAGFIDVYLLDFKYGNNKCAIEISDAPGYFEACTRNHLYANRFGELIVRVLVLPEHNECCTRRILQWIHDKLGPWTRVNLMFQYRPEWRAREKPELNRRLSVKERSEALHIASEVGLLNLVRG